MRVGPERQIQRRRIPAAPDDALHEKRVPRGLEAQLEASVQRTGLGSGRIRHRNVEAKFSRDARPPPSPICSTPATREARAPASPLLSTPLRIKRPTGEAQSVQVCLGSPSLTPLPCLARPASEASLASPAVSPRAAPNVDDLPCTLDKFEWPQDTEHLPPPHGTGGIVCSAVVQAGSDEPSSTSREPSTSIAPWPLHPRSASWSATPVQGAGATSGSPIPRRNSAGDTFPSTAQHRGAVALPQTPRVFGCSSEHPCVAPSWPLPPRVGDSHCEQPARTCTPQTTPRGTTPPPPRTAQPLTPTGATLPEACHSTGSLQGSPLVLPTTAFDQRLQQKHSPEPSRGSRHVLSPVASRHVILSPSTRSLVPATTGSRSGDLALVREPSPRRATTGSIVGVRPTRVLSREELSRRCQHSGSVESLEQYGVDEVKAQVAQAAVSPKATVKQRKDLKPVQRDSLRECSPASLPSDLSRVHSPQEAPLDIHGELRLAVEGMRVDTVRQILEHADGPALVLTADADGHTLLHLAAMTPPGDAACQMSAVLLSFGANVNSGNLLGETALTLATRSVMDHAAAGERLRLLKLLFDALANVNVTDAVAGETPLIEAASFGNAEACKMLLEFRADPSVESRAGFTAKRFADRYGHTQAAQLLRTSTEPSPQLPTHVSKETLREHYEFLGLPVGASKHMVRRRSRQMALRHHPAKKPETQDCSQFDRVLEAYMRIFQA